MAVTESTISTILKERFLPEIQEMFQEGTGVLQKMTANKFDARGGDAEKRVRLTRNDAIAFLDDGDTLPLAGNATFGQYTIDPKFAYAVVEVSGISKARTRGAGDKAFLEAFADESEHTMRKFKKLMNQRCWGEQEGYLAKVGSVSSQIITLDTVGVAGAVTSFVQNAGVRYLGQLAGDYKVDIIDSDGSTIHVAGATVSAISASTPSVTIATGVDLTSVADGDFVALRSTKSTSDTWVANHFEGIFPAIDDGSARTSYHGLSRTTYPLLKSVVLKNDTAQREISEALMEDLFQSVELSANIDVSETPGYELRCSQGIYAAFKAQQLALKRYMTTDLKAGGKGLEFNGIGLVRDPDAPYEAMYLLNWDKFMCAETDPLHWLDDDGSVVRANGRKDSWEAWLRWCAEFFARDVHCMGVIRNLNETIYNHRTH